MKPSRILSSLLIVSNNRALIANNVKIWKRKIAFRLAIFFVFFIVAEVWVSLVVGRPTQQPDPQLKMVYHEVLGFKPQANFVGYTLEKPLELNEKGFRFDKSFSVESNPIVAIGDSFLFGQGVQRKNTFAHKYCETKKAYLNFGVPGYDVKQSVDCFFEYGHLYKTKMVHLHFYGNDIYFNAVPKTFVNIAMRKKRDRYAFIRHSALLSYLGKVYMSALDPHNVVKRLARDWDPQNLDLPSLELLWQKAFEEIDRLSKFCRSHNLELKVIIHPLQGQRLEDVNRYQSKLIPALEQRKIDYLDLRAYLNEEDYIPMDGHYNEKGHHKVYEALLKFMEK